MRYIVIGICCVAMLGVCTAQSVVINKYQNGGTNGKDVVELLLIERGVSLEGMMIKDFSNSGGMLRDSGGVYRFTNNPLWRNLHAGTLITLRRDTATADINPRDYTLDVGLDDKNYFTLVRGNFDIRADGEVVMLKSAGASPDGMSDGIHTFASSLSTAEQTTLSRPYLYTSKTIGMLNIAFAKNSTRRLSDFDGRETDTLSTLMFGQPSNVQNGKFIDSLRAGDPVYVVDPEPPMPFAIFPNPANASIDINTDEGIRSVEVMDILGKVHHVNQQLYISSGQIDIRMLPVGTYCIRVTTKEATYNNLILINH